MPIISEIQIDSNTRKNNETPQKKKFFSAVVEVEFDFDDYKLCFNQWCEIQFRQKLAVDRIDIALRCVRLRWQKSLGKSEVLSAGRAFGLVLIDSIKELAHIVSKDLFILMFDDSFKQRKASLNLAESAVGGRQTSTT